MDRKYRVVCFMRIDCEDSEVEPLTLEEAEAEVEHQMFMQPEDMFRVEEIISE